MTVRFVILYDYLHFHVATALEGHGPLVIKASRSHLDTPHSMGLLRLSDQPDEKICKARAERDGTRAETRFRLSPKRTSQFKSVGASVLSTAGRRGVRISLSNAG